MSRFTRERADADWYRGLKVPPSVIRNIDEKTKKAVSASGGTWAPSSPIVIGGAGLELQCRMQLTNAVAQGTFKFGADDYFKNEAPISRTIDDSPMLLMGSPTFSRDVMPWLSSALSLTPALRTRRAGAFLRMPLRVPDGSRLSQVVVRFKVGQSHSGVPSVLPRARVVRISADGVVSAYPYPTSSIVDAEGWVRPALPASGTAWYASGAIKSLTLTYDSTQAPAADTSRFGYALEWREEDGANAFADHVGNSLVHIALTVSQSDLRPY